MKLTKVTNKAGDSVIIPKDILPLLREARSDYMADSQGMYEAGEQLSSTYTSYCDCEEINRILNEQGSKKTAEHYAYTFGWFSGIV